jgi:phosphonopyruvate decarboxylase
MQNSGLGNAVNPLASLMDGKVYALPCLLVVGWRGEPGTKDEPQHVTQGAVTLPQLDLLGIPYAVLSPDTGEDAFRALFDSLCRELAAGRIAALVVRKGALTSSARPAYGNDASLTREKAAEGILRSAAPSDVFVSTTGKLSREVYELREAFGEDHRRDFLTVGSMGHASMIALRIAEEKPDRRVWCLDGDGALLMHLGALPLIGRRKPANLVHVVINNGAHETVGGMPVCSGALDIGALARAAGYARVFRADSAASLDAALREIASLSGPILLEVRCACGARADLGRPATTPVQNRDAFMDFLKKV